ncbi:hypothetical protein [Chondromyces crocatus]|uniref:Secreted protein n=1 Tax=Chondromyces crocatus TaxID=52 RepID=A0A0K1ESB6_CHOCO|nr:hypothetical protein [Chondromyces crocatus]AKT43825.1 uncharacterized protein CMC5_080620 [Chondromyces crocatus]
MRQRDFRLSLAAILAGTTACSASAPPSGQPAHTVTVALPEPGTDEGAAPGEATPTAHQTIQSLGPLYIGQAVEEVRSLLGREASLVQHDEERDRWRSSGYDPERELVFALGFDEVLVYENPAPGLPPIWKVYVHEGQVRMLKASVLLHAMTGLETIGFPPSCFLTRPGHGVIQTFGQPDVLVRDHGERQQTFHYLGRGLSVIVDKGSIQVFDIFGALPVAKREQVRRQITPAQP